MGLSSVLNSANTGLRVTQSGLDVVARNIANAGTPGYTRKAQNQANLLLGNNSAGVRDLGVTRSVNKFLQAQLRTETAGFNDLDIRNDFYQRIDQIFGTPGDPNALDGVLNAFTQSMQALTASPDAFAVRQQVVDDADFLAQTIRQLSGELETLRQSADASLSDVVLQVNDMLQALHGTNAQIALSVENGRAPADLLDERDKVIDRLSEFIGIRVNELPDGRVAIFTEDGNTLLEGFPVTLSFEPPDNAPATVAGTGAILNASAAAFFTTGNIVADAAGVTAEGTAVGAGDSLDGVLGVTAADDFTITIDGTVYTVNFVTGGGAHDFSGGTNTVTFDLDNASDTIGDLVAGLDAFFDAANAGTHSDLGVAHGGTGIQFTLGANAEAIRLQDSGGTGLDKLNLEAIGDGPNTQDRSISQNADLQDLIANSRTLQVDLGAGTLGTLTFGTGAGEIQTRADLVAQLNGLVGIDAVLSGNAIEVSTTNAANHEDGITLTASDASVITALGLGAGTTFTQPASNLLSQGFTAGETLTIQIGSNPPLVVTFGTNGGVGEVSTAAELNTALTALTGGTASIGATGNLRVITNNNSDNIVLAGTANISVLGTQPGTYTPTSPFPNPFSSTIKLVNATGFKFDLINSGGLRSGRVGGLIELRDTVLSEAQAQLDELAHNLALSLSNRDVASAAAVSGAQTGLEIDTTGLQSGNPITLQYTETPPGAQRTVTIIRVDDSSALPLSNDLTADPNDTVLGIDFSGGLAAAAAAIDAALGPAVDVSVPAGNILRILDDGVAGTTNIDALTASVTVTSTQDDGFSIPLFVDGGNLPTIYSASLDGGNQKTGFASRITINSLVKADNELLVRHTSAPLTPIGDPDRPLELLSRLTDNKFDFSPASGIGATSNPFNGTISSFAQRIVALQTGQAEIVNRERATKDLVVSNLQDRFLQDTGVTIDNELSQLIILENSFAANARVIQAADELMRLLMSLV